MGITRVSQESLSAGSLTSVAKSTGQGRRYDLNQRDLELGDPLDMHPGGKALPGCLRQLENEAKRYRIGKDYEHNTEQERVGSHYYGRTNVIFLAACK